MLADSLVVLNGAQILLQLGIRAGTGSGEQGRRDPGLGDKPSRKIDSSNSIVHAMPLYVRMWCVRRLALGLRLLRKSILARADTYRTTRRECRICKEL